MFWLNNVVLIGRLTKDPELRYTQGGTAITRFALAVDKNLSREKRQEFEAKGQPTADFINITVWGRMAENSANYLAKGRLVAVNGRIQTSTYKDDQGNTRWYTDVVAREVEFLEWGDDNRGQSQGFDSQGSSPQQSSSQGSSNDFSGIEGFDSVDDDNIPF